MARFVALEAHTHAPRDLATRRVLDVLGAESGFVTGTERLGGLALMLRIVLPPAAARTLVDRLRHAEIVVDAGAEGLVTPPDESTDLEGSLLLRFFADEPDLSIDIPEVPG